VRLGGFVHLPRLLDKCRAMLPGLAGEYEFPCALDRRFLSFVGIAPDDFLAAVREGRGDAAMLAWVRERMSPERQPHEIEAWSRWLEALVPGDAGRHTAFADALRTQAPGRDDIRTTFDRLDLDDYATFGGNP
jgi:hypothetical protein